MDLCRLIAGRLHELLLAVPIMVESTSGIKLMTSKAPPAVLQSYM